MPDLIQFVNNPYTKEIKIKELHPGISKEEIKNQLEKKKLAIEVDWKNIDIELENIQRTGITSKEIVIKKGYGPTIRIIDDNNIPREVKGDIFQTTYSTMYKMIQIQGIVTNKGMFLNKRKFFLATENNPNQLPLLTDKTISYEILGNHIEYYANTSGYLALNDNTLTIIPPVTINDDKTAKIYIVAPVKYGKKDLINDFELLDFKKTDIKKLLEYNKVKYITLKESKKMVPGRNGKIKFIKNEKIREVKKGEIVAEKIEPIHGTEGQDINGNIIRCNPVNDVVLHTGENIRSLYLESEKITFFKSEIDGVLYSSENKITVKKDLRIHSDLTLEIGNLTYSGDIFIEGNVNPGMEINCGGNLHIKKSIENGAIINCNGDVTVGKGIIGKKTIFNSKGNTIANFIQDTNVNLNGNLTVNSYIYDSTVFTRGNITVNGKTIHGDSHGSVIGSKINSMGNIIIHSAGSLSSKTVLTCGIDIYISDSISKIVSIMPTIERKILQIQLSIGMDLTRKDSKDKVLKLPQVEKKLLISNLTELKKLIQYKEILKDRKYDLKQLEYNKDLNDLTISIKNFVKAGVEITIGKFKKRISIDQRKTIFKLVDNRIIDHTK